MKKITVIVSLVMVSLFLSYCSSSRRAAKNKVPKTTYATDLSTVIMNNCSPCHIPEKNGNKKPYDNYDNVKTDIDEMIRRISLNPGDKGFMPFRKKEKLPEEVIAVFQKWKGDGMLEN